MAKLGRDILKAIETSLKLTECYFLALDRRAEIYKIEFVDSQKKRSTFTFASNDPFVKAIFKTEKIIVAEEIPFMVPEANLEQRKNLEIIEEGLQELEFALIAPLIIDKELIGILFLGEKTKGRAFTVQDVKFLETVAKEAGFALANVMAYKYAMERVFETKKQEESF